MDALVQQSTDGMFYALKAGWAWELNLDWNQSPPRLVLVNSNHQGIENLWQRVPVEFDFVFTMPHLDDVLESRNDAIPGKLKIFHLFDVLIDNIFYRCNSFSQKWSLLCVLSKWHSIPQ